MEVLFKISSFLMAAMERKKSPPVLGLPSETCLQQILTDCLSMTVPRGLTPLTS